MLCGDNHQIPAPKVTPWFATLVEAAHDRSLRQRSESGSPRPQGLAMLRQARLVSLVRQMRAIEDPDFVRDQNEMRSTSELQPGLLYSLNIDDEIEKAKVDHAHVEAKRFGFDGEYVILSKPPYKLITRQHPYQLAFALTDFKLQGKTLNKLIISAPPRDEPPHFKLSTLLKLEVEVE